MIGSPLQLLYGPGGGAGSATGFATTVSTFAALPAAASYTGLVALVLTTTGVPFISRHVKGLYYSDGAVWSYKGPIDADEDSQLQVAAGPRLLGRYTASAGVIQEMTFGSGITVDPATGIISASGMPAGVATEIQYRNGGAFGAVAGSVVGSGLSAGSVAFARLSAGAATPLTGLSDTYGFIDGGFIVREHGINAQSLNLGSGGTAGYYSIGNLSGQGTGGFLSFDPTDTTLTGGSGGLRVFNSQGGNIQMSASDGSVYISNDAAGNFVIVDSGGGVTARAAGDLGGMYADPSGNTYLGWYSAAFHMTVASDGSVFCGENSTPSQAFRVGPDYGTGGYWVFNGQNTGSQVFFDIVSGNNGVSSSIRVFSDVQCGEFAAVGSSGEYFSNSTSGDTALKGDPGGSNFFLIGVGSGAAQLVVGNSIVQITGNAGIAGSLGIGATNPGGTKLYLGAGTTSQSPLRFAVGVLRTTPQDGTFEYDGVHYYATIGTTRFQLDNAPSAVVLSTTAINSKTVANTSIYTVPAGKTAVITGAIIRCTAAVSITVGPSMGVGNAAGTSNICGAVATGLTTSGQLYSFMVLGINTVTAAAGQIYLNLTVAATGTSETVTVDLLGYLV